MSIETIQKLVQQGESRTLEFKKSTNQLKPAMETLCAFLNHEGGKVLIGVDNQGQILGQDVTDHTKQEIANELRKIEPATNIEIEYVPVGINKFLILFDASNKQYGPYIYDGRPYQRNESSTSKMSQHHYERLLVEREQFNHAWDKLFVAHNYSIDALDHDEINYTIQQSVQAGRIPAEALQDSIENILSRLQLIKDGKLVNAAVALFGKKVQSDYPQCLIKMARFKGNDKLGDFIDNQRIYGHAFKILKNADAFIRRHLSIASSYQSDKFERIDKPALPLLAVREALINAICHRDYSHSSTSISLAIFDDRLELWNNGFLPKGIKLTDLKHAHESHPRNHLIADVFYDRGFIESWGTGTIKMIELCKKEGLPEPEFLERSGGLAVIFRMKENLITPPLAKHLNVRQLKIVELLGEKPGLSPAEIKNLSELSSERTVSRDLSILKKMGIIEPRGKGPARTWHLIVRPFK